MRRRSAGLSLQTSNADVAGPSVVKQPTSPDEERKPHSASSEGSFGGFVQSHQSGLLPTPLEGNPDSFVDDMEDWHDASMMSGFSDAGINASQLHPSERQKVQSHSVGDLDWTAWETPRSTTPAVNVGEDTKYTPANEQFLAAFEQVGLSEHARQPSPPIIDLRPMQRKLERQKELASSGLQADDIRFFEQFDANPRDAMAKSREDSFKNGVSLTDRQRESMHEAQASPMNIQVTPNRAQALRADYFGGDGDLLTGSPPVHQASTSDGQPALVSPTNSSQPRREGSWTESAGVWAGSLRRTFGSLRGHLPSARDFYVPENEGESSQNATRTPSPSKEFFDMGTAQDIDQKTQWREEISESHKRHSRKLVQSAGHSQSTPFASTSDPHAASPPAVGRPHSLSHQLPPSLFGTPGHHSAAPVSGAPGFDPNTKRNWNTGSWSLTSQEETERRKKPIAVSLKGRREETQEVVDDSLAARLTARLPKRLQLGKTWKLLYSSDQHGISLTTLYWKVASGLDADKNSSSARLGLGNGGGGVADAEGWLRGASATTKAALTGSGIQRVGSGLSMSDAGLILAVKDNDEHIFGAFVNERLRAQSNYYGNGECFLWKQTDAGTLRSFPWTGKNDYMVLTEAHYLSIGGGEGKYGLWIDGALESGVSAKCPAFDNEILCDGLEHSASNESEGRFECITLEVWACGID